jgi:predicted DNA-binding protein (MmcQ/YjbR family)
MDLETLRTYCLAKPGVTEGFPFGSDTLVFKVMGKAFALTGVDEPPPQSVNLKCDPDRALQLRDQYRAITPGYHMNKKHWNTCSMDGSIPEKLFYELIDHSYELVCASLSKTELAKLRGKPAAKPAIKKTAAKAKTTARAKVAAKGKPSQKKKQPTAKAIDKTSKAKKK